MQKRWCALACVLILGCKSARGRDGSEAKNFADSGAKVVYTADTLQDRNIRVTKRQCTPEQFDRVRAREIDGIECGNVGERMLRELLDFQELVGTGCAVTNENGTFFRFGASDALKELRKPREVTFFDSNSALQGDACYQKVLMGLVAGFDRPPGASPQPANPAPTTTARGPDFKCPMSTPPVMQFKYVDADATACISALTRVVRAHGTARPERGSDTQQELIWNIRGVQHVDGSLCTIIDEGNHTYSQEECQILFQLAYEMGLVNTTREGIKSFPAIYAVKWSRSFAREQVAVWK